MTNLETFLTQVLALTPFYPEFPWTAALFLLVCIAIYEGLKVMMMTMVYGPRYWLRLPLA